MVCCRTLQSHTGKVYTYTCTYILCVCVWLFWFGCISCIIVLLEMMIKLLEWVRNGLLYFALSILKYQVYPLVNQRVVFRIISGLDCCHSFKGIERFRGKSIAIFIVEWLEWKLFFGFSSCGNSVIQSCRKNNFFFSFFQEIISGTILVISLMRHLCVTYLGFRNLSLSISKM